LAQKQYYILPAHEDSEIWMDLRLRRLQHALTIPRPLASSVRNYFNKPTIRPERAF